MNPEPEHSTQPAPSLPEEAKCCRCGYQLRGLTSHVCPECGSPFDPGIPATYHVPVWPDRLRRFGCPLGTISHALMLCFVFMMLLAYSSPGWPADFVGTALVALAIAVAIIVPTWILRIGARFIAVRMPDAPPSQPLRRWLWVPLMLIIVTSAILFPWPTYLRFYASMGDFDKALDNLSTMPTQMRKTIGLYRVESITTQANGCVFVEVGRPQNRSVGFWKIPSSGKNPDKQFYESYIRYKLTEEWYIGRTWDGELIICK